MSCKSLAVTIKLTMSGKVGTRNRAIFVCIKANKKTCESGLAALYLKSEAKNELS